LCHGRGDERRGVERRSDNFSARAQSKRLGNVFEGFALEYLVRQRLRFVARNVTCRGGEIDLVMREPDGVLVFVEVRARAGSRYGGAVASVGREKQRRIVRAAQHFLAKRADTESACRFDIVAFDGRRIAWLRDAFRADGLG
jgi:putative endonuclease